MCLEYTVLCFPLSDISYTLTLDADLQATRVTSRGLFMNNNDRSLTDNAKIYTTTPSSTPFCQDFQVYVQVSKLKSWIWFSLHFVRLSFQSTFREVTRCVFVLRSRCPVFVFFFPQQEAPDLVNSVSLKVEIEQQNADVNPVLDPFSRTAWDFFVSDAFAACLIWSLHVSTGRRKGQRSTSKL